MVYAAKHSSELVNPQPIPLGKRYTSRAMVGESGIEYIFLTSSTSAGKFGEFMKIRRSMVLVPANIPKYVANAKHVDTDVVILDIQDAVANNDLAKRQARQAAVNALVEGGFRARELSVRVNAAGSPWFQDDIAAVVQAGVDTIMLTHTRGLSDVHFAERCVQSCARAKEVDIRVEIDTPSALADLEDIARQSALVTGISLGAQDYRLEMWMPTHGPYRPLNEDALTYARGKIVTIARSKGWNAADTSRPRSRELEDVRASMRKLRDFGFDGCLILTPSTVSVANEVFGVTSEELTWARDIVTKWRALDKQDWDKTYRVIDGVGVVKPVYEYACRVLMYQAVLDGDPSCVARYRKHGLVSSEYLEEQGSKPED